MRLRVFDAGFLSGARAPRSAPPLVRDLVPHHRRRRALPRAYASGVARAIGLTRKRQRGSRCAVWRLLPPVAEIVRTAIGSDARLPMRRTLEERLMVRWPGAYAALSRADQPLVAAIAPAACVAAPQRAVGLGSLGARGSRSLSRALCARRHYDAPQEWLIAGMPSVYRGHAGLREWFAELREAWKYLDHTPLELVDPPATYSPSSARSGCVPGQAVSSWTRSSGKSFGWSEA